MKDKVSKTIVSLTYLREIISFLDMDLVQRERKYVDELEYNYFRALRYMIIREIDRIIEELEE